MMMMMIVRKEEVPARLRSHQSGCERKPTAVESTDIRSNKTFPGTRCHDVFAAPAEFSGSSVAVLWQIHPVV